MVGGVDTPHPRDKNTVGIAAKKQLGEMLIQPERVHPDMRYYEIQDPHTEMAIVTYKVD